MISDSLLNCSVFILIVFMSNNQHVNIINLLMCNSRIKCKLLFLQLKLLCV